MNTENRYPVTASLFMLREIKQRQEKVNRGYQLLKRKAEALRIRGRQATAELAMTQAVMGHTLKEAYISLAAIKFTNGESNALILENVDEAQIRVQRIPENISGVSTVALQAVENVSVSDSMRYAGLGAGGHRTSEAKKAFREAIRILIKFASLRNTCYLLDEAIRFTLRKVNGIEKVIIPKLRNTETYILMEMDEREREEFHRLKMVKAKKNTGRFLGNIHLQNSKVWDRRGYIGNRKSWPNSQFIRFLSTLGISVFVSDSSPSNLASTKQSLKSVGDKRSCAVLSSSEPGGDYKPVCYPHYWDDEDLLF